ncbi:MAG: hypothetical protein FWH12_05650 [Treponema sp.]|nr:hypothetical protein [Treponema sp.]
MSDERYNDKPLSKLHHQYQQGELDRKDLEGRIFSFLLNNYEKYRHIRASHDWWGEFLSWLYPRISRSIDLYQDRGSSFDAYIMGLIQGAAREYRSREADHYITETMWWLAKSEEMKTHEGEPDYADPSQDDSLPEDLNQRQVLILLLKSYHFITDEFMRMAAKRLGMEGEEIMLMLNELRTRRSAQEERIRKLREQIHCQHYRCLAYQKRMHYAQPGTDYHMRMQLRYLRARKRFFSMKKRLEGMSVTASNKLVADVMGIPRGTVDSGLHALRKKPKPPPS